MEKEVATYTTEDAEGTKEIAEWRMQIAQ